MKISKIIYSMAIFLSFCLASSVQAGLDSKTDGEFVTISGKVTAVAPQSFKLLSSGKTILVEMDDYDWDADGYKLVEGDQVVVTGRIDHDFLEKKKVEAGSVYVKGLNTYFYANSDDEEGPPYISVIYSYAKTFPEGAHVDLQGKVKKVEGREFVLDTGIRKITIDTKDMLYNPMDNKGVTKIKKGDRVRVSGLVDREFFGGKEIVAHSVLELGSK